MGSTQEYGWKKEGRSARRANTQQGNKSHKRRGESEPCSQVLCRNQPSQNSMSSAKMALSEKSSVETAKNMPYGRELQHLWNKTSATGHKTQRSRRGWGPSDSTKKPPGRRLNSSPPNNQQILERRKSTGEMENSPDNPHTQEKEITQRDRVTALYHSFPVSPNCLNDW